MAQLEHLAHAPTAARPGWMPASTADGCWPPDALAAFSLRMAGHGLSVSSSMMRHDRRYALEQLRLAHTMADDRLRELAMALFRAFEQHQSGVARPH